MVDYSGIMYQCSMIRHQGFRFIPTPPPVDLQDVATGFWEFCMFLQDGNLQDLGPPQADFFFYRGDFYGIWARRRRIFFFYRGDFYRIWRAAGEIFRFYRGEIYRIW